MDEKSKGETEMKMIYGCGRPSGGCCPKVEYDVANDTVDITDDDGDIVSMTAEQFKRIVKDTYEFL